MTTVERKTASTPAPAPARYVGVTRAGVTRAGALVQDADVAEFVEGKFRSGWRRLTVQQGGDTVGSIEVAYHNNSVGRRSWWAAQ